MPHYDYDKDYPFAAFITNLGKYNEGALVGEWVKFPTTLEELKRSLSALASARRMTSSRPMRNGSSRTTIAMWTGSMTCWASTQTLTN